MLPVSEEREIKFESKTTFSLSSQLSALSFQLSEAKRDKGTAGGDGRLNERILIGLDY